MPSKFLDQMSRNHIVKPMGNGRRIDLKNLDLGVGVHLGFVPSVTAPVSALINITRGLASGPDGEEIRVATARNISAGDYGKALARDSYTVNVSETLESLSGAYATLDPATHSILITLDAERDVIRCLKITNAEAAAIEAAIGAGETGNANADFSAATANHRARLRGTFKNPDTFASVTTVAKEYVLATATLDVIGGNVSVVTLRRERKQVWATLT